MYYRGCWHIVSRGFLIRYRQSMVISYHCLSSLTTEFYIPKNFIIHAALLGQSFLHCRKFPTAASRRSLGRVSVPVWLFCLSAQLSIVALVGRYLTNQLMLRRAIHQRSLAGPLNIRRCLPIYYPVLAIVSNSYPRLMGRFPTCYSPVRHQVLLPRSTCMYQACRQR